MKQINHKEHNWIHKNKYRKRHKKRRRSAAILNGIVAFFRSTKTYELAFVSANSTRYSLIATYTLRQPQAFLFRQIVDKSRFNPDCFIEVPDSKSEALKVGLTEEIADTYFDAQRNENAYQRRAYWNKAHLLSISTGIFCFLDFYEAFLRHNVSCRSPPIQSEFSTKFRLEVYIMAYNKAKEEKKWLRWKEAEEKELRRLGVSNDVIMRLREADWEDFKAERIFFEHFPDTDTYLDQQMADDVPQDIQTVQDLIDNIDSEELYQLILSVDKLTLQIALLMMDGHTQREIAKQLNLTDKAVYRRVDRLKEKIKKYL